MSVSKSQSIQQASSRSREHTPTVFNHVQTPKSELEGLLSIQEPRTKSFALVSSRSALNSSVISSCVAMGDVGYVVPDLSAVRSRNVNLSARIL
jgi:hypothetical protein